MMETRVNGEDGMPLWRTRLGRLKWVGAPLLLLALAAAALLTRTLLQTIGDASTGRGGPRPVAIERIVAGQVGAGRYVTVAGYGLSDDGYRAVAGDGGGDEAVAVYYPILDDETFTAVYARYAPDVIEREPGPVQVSGMTRRTPRDLKALLTRDAALTVDAGYRARVDIYIDEDQRPPGIIGLILALISLAAIAALAITGLLSPRLLFHPQPCAQAAHRRPPLGGGEPPRVTGRLRRLRAPGPPADLADETRRIEMAPVHLSVRGQRDLLIRTHAPRDGDDAWAAVVDSLNLIDIEPGLLYTWDAHWAVRFRLASGDSASAALYVTFDSAWAQAAFVDRLKRMGFLVGRWVG